MLPNVREWKMSEAKGKLFQTESEGRKQEKIMIKAKAQVKIIAYSMQEAVAATPKPQ